MAKARKSKTKLKKPAVKKTLNFKVKPSEAKAIEAIAQKFTKGNVTALVRLAVKAYKPRRKDLLAIRPTTRK